MLVLGLETSCDETAAALVDDQRRILAHAVLSQTVAHQRFGGVVPEIAARAHLEHLDSLVESVFAQANRPLDAVSGIAATCGPGLIGGVMVGAMTGKALALALDKPFLAVNHLEAHALTARLTDAVDFPFLLLLVSGGHCQLLAVEGVGRYHLYGSTIDDAVGEAFDKTAKLLGLGFPGGPAVERAALQGNAARFPLPQPMRGRADCAFSFSGLKTAVRQVVQSLPAINTQDKADIAAAFQYAVAACLVDRTARALDIFKTHYKGDPTLVVAGGVAANAAIKNALSQLCHEKNARLVAPPPALCTDNGAMVAWAGLEKLRLGLIDGLDFAPRPRWGLGASVF